MKTADFLRAHRACQSGAKYALGIGPDMADVWDAMIRDGKHEWLLWTATRKGVFPDAVLRRLACRFVRETPLADGRKVWDLLADARSRTAVEVAERHADGLATDEELSAASAAAGDAAGDAAWNAAWAAAWNAAGAAAWNAAWDAWDAACDASAAVDAAWAAAWAAQTKIIASFGNPFRA